MTVQKSNAASTITMMNVSISSPMTALRKRNEEMEAPLKRTWKRHATGLFAVENSVSTRPSSFACLY